LQVTGTAGSDVSRASRTAWVRRVSKLGFVLGLASATAAVVVARTTGAGWAAAIGLAVLLGAGIYLWGYDETKGWGDLGQGIVISCVVAITLMAVQRDADTRRERSAERQSLQLTLTMERHLRGIGLVGRDMHGFFLAEKRLDDANLERADLRGADLRATSLVGARLGEARLDGAELFAADLSHADFGTSRDRNDPTDFTASLRDADLQEASLVDANLDGADLTRANLTNARLREASLAFARLGGAALIYADLRQTDLEEADLRGSRLGGATLCAAELHGAKLEGALYDGSTRWPPGFDPGRHGARRSGQARGFENPDGSGLSVGQNPYRPC
jgi:uncharacterized protein YjbI with pentapeptide repeats